MRSTEEVRAKYVPLGLVPPPFESEWAAGVEERLATLELREWGLAAALAGVIVGHILNRLTRKR